MLCTDSFKLPSQWTLVQSEESVAYFQNAAGDVLSINYFGMEPDIGADVHDADALRAFYRDAAESGGLAMVEVDPVSIASLPAVRTVLKGRMEPHGLVFIACFTLPFANCSYVFKIQSSEGGITGMRESMIFASLNVPIEAWQEDPYDPRHKADFMRNRADSPEYDAQFPDHPLSKVRLYLDELAEQIEVAPAVAAARPFKFKGPRTRFWSRFWRK